MPPQPIIFERQPTITNAMLNQSKEKFIPERSVFNPMLAKKTGLKIMYEFMSILRSMYGASKSEQNTTPTM